MSKEDSSVLLLDEGRDRRSGRVAVVIVCVLSSLLLFCMSKNNSDMTVASDLDFMTSQPIDNMTFLGMSSSVCATLDDDSIYPRIQVEGGDLYPSITDCEEQDAIAWCDSCQRSTVCDKYCGDSLALCVHNPNGAFQYTNPCVWQTISELPKLCADTFQNHPPLLSRNIGPTVEGPYIPPIRSCDFHSFCQTCVDDSEPHGINKYCRAVVYHYNFHKRSARHFFEDLHDDVGTSFWCQPSVLSRIEDGSFFSASS